VAGLTANLNQAANILESNATNSPGSLLQAIAFFVVWAVCWLPLAIACAIAINWRPPQPLTTQQKLPLLASLYAIAPLVLWLANRVLGASFADYGFVRNLELFSSLAIGFALGVFSLVILFALQTALGWINWQKQDELKLGAVLLPTFLLALWISGTEELIFRGFLLTQLQQDFVPIIAAAISSAIFALLHLVWEQRETLPQLPGLWLMGMVLVVARWVDGGSLGLAWGLHTGWVWAIACLDTLGIINYTGTGSEWVTGKYGKPLAGVAGIGFLLVTGAILWFLSVGTATLGVF
jgi:hypothetical protein